MITGMPRIAIATADFDRAVSIFRDKFGMPVVDLSETSVDSLGARLAMCVPSGGSNIELMSPARPESPLSRSLSSFLDRRGEGLFALMLEAAVPDDEAVELAERGLNVLPTMAGAGGRDVHPNSTRGVLIRVYPTNSYPPPATVDRSSRISGILRAIVAVQEMSAAERVYSFGFGLPLAAPEEDGQRGVFATRCIPPQGGQIELVCIRDPDRPFARAVADFHTRQSEGLFGLVLEADDPVAEAEHLAQAGLRAGMAEGEPGTAEVTVLGTRILIEPARNREVDC